MMTARRHHRQMSSSAPPPSEAGAGRAVAAAAGNATCAAAPLRCGVHDAVACVGLQPQGPVRGVGVAQTGMRGGPWYSTSHRAAVVTVAVSLRAGGRCERNVQFEQECREYGHDRVGGGRRTPSRFLRHRHRREHCQVRDRRRAPYGTYELMPRGDRQYSPILQMPGGPNNCADAYILLLSAATSARTHASSNAHSVIPYVTRFGKSAEWAPGGTP